MESLMSGHYRYLRTFFDQRRIAHGPTRLHIRTILYDRLAYRWRKRPARMPSPRRYPGTWRRAPPEHSMHGIDYRLPPMFVPPCSPHSRTGLHKDCTTRLLQALDGTRLHRDSASQPTTAVCLKSRRCNRLRPWRNPPHGRGWLSPEISTGFVDNGQARQKGEPLCSHHARRG